MLIIVGLLVGLTSGVAVAAPPQVGLEGGKGEVVGLDDPATPVTQEIPMVTLAPYDGVGLIACFAIECGVTMMIVLAPGGNHLAASETVSGVSKLAGLNQIGLSEN